MKASVLAFLYLGKREIMHIKIFNQSQLVLLKNINPFLRKYSVPEEVLYEIGYILSYKKRKSGDYIALILNPIKNDTEDILKNLWIYLEEVDIHDNNFHPIKVKHKKKHMKRKRIWTWFDIYIPDNDRTIYVVYPMKKKNLYKKGD